MKVKIIKRSDREATAAKARAVESEPKKDTTLEATAAIKSWIEELRQKRETEAELSRKLYEEQSEKLFAEDYCS